MLRHEITKDETMPEPVKQWLCQDFERQTLTGLSLKDSVALWSVKYSNGEMHRYTIAQMADKFGLQGAIDMRHLQGTRVKHQKTGNAGIVMESFKVVAVKYSNGEMHRYTVDQMADKFGLQGEVTEGMTVMHRKTSNVGIVLTSFEGKHRYDQSIVSGPAKGWPEALCNAEDSAVLDTELQRLSTWEFKSHVVAKLVDGRTLSCVAWRVFEEWGFISTFALDRTILWCAELTRMQTHARAHARAHRAWLCKVEQEYNSVPYHSATHAADVLQVVHYLLKVCELQQLLTDLQCLAMVFSAIVHDLGHNGRTNIFLRKTKDPRALRYNDVSVHEHGHVAGACMLQRRPHAVHATRMRKSRSMHAACMRFEDAWLPGS